MVNKLAATAVLLLGCGGAYGQQEAALDLYEPGIDDPYNPGLEETEPDSDVAGVDVVERWDVNDDGLIDRGEWVAIGPGSAFDAWDLDRSGRLDRDETDFSARQRWDEDGDGRLSEGEWQSAENENWEGW